MPKVSPVQNSFIYGEASPRSYGRFDAKFYPHAAKTLENVLIQGEGGAFRRPGSKYVAEIKTSSLKTRLVTFEFSTTQTYILEFGNQYIRFYRNQGQIQAASAYELATPYLTADLFQLQFAQDADTMWIVHPDYEPRKLTRSAHNSWTLTAYAPTADPFGSDGNDTNPSCVAMFEQRILFANSNDDPQKIWASKSGDFEDMTVGVNAGDGFVYVIASDKVNAIRWLKPSSKGLMMGTLGATFSMTSGTEGVAITPTNVSIKRDTTYGAANILPETIGNFVYYVERDLNHLRELGFSFDVDSQEALDMTKISDHIAKAADPLDTDGFTQIAYQQSPVSRLWCVRNDGQLAVFTREIEDGIMGWSRQLSGSDSRDSGKYESVAIIPKDGGDDEVWVIVKRYINSSTVRYIEFFMPETFDHQQDAFFVDSGLSLDNPKTITNIIAKTIIDDMEYSSDAAAQNIYVSSDISSALTGDLLDEDCSDISDWTDDSKKDALSEVDPAGQFHLHCPSAEVGEFAKIGRDIGVLTNTFTVEIRMNLDVLGTTLEDGLILSFDHDDVRLNIQLGTDGLFVANALGSYVEVGTNIVDTGVWTIWRFLVTFTTPASATVDVYKDNVLVEAGVDCSYSEGTFIDGEIFVRLEGTNVNTELHIDYIKIADGLFTPIPALQSYSENIIIKQGSYSLKTIAKLTESLADTLTGTLASAADLSGLNSIKFNVYASRTGSNFKIGFKDSGGTITEHTPNILIADEWQEETVDISAVTDANKDDITQIIITILNADVVNTFYIDNVHSPKVGIIVTAASHGFSNGDLVKIVDVVGMTEVNNQSFVVADKDTNDFTLKNEQGTDYVDGSTYTAYISGGEVRKKVTAITGLTHLVGEEVAIIADGLSVATKIVSSGGGITLDVAASLVHVGLSYVSNIRLLSSPEGSATGTAIGKKQRTYKLSIKFYQSLGVQYGPDADHLDSISETELFTGDKIRSFPGDWSREGGALLRQANPLPLNILSVTRISDIVDD